MNTLNYIAARFESLRASERGQGALEYIAIVVGLVVLIAIGFAIAGQDILDEARDFVNRVTGAAGG